MIYLYIKQHTITGLKYFGMTLNKDPVKYRGSGSHWKNHYKKHGKDNIITTGLWLFYDEDECSNFALKFSEDNNIVESKEWANKIPETGRPYNKGIVSTRKGKTYKEIYGIEKAAKITATKIGRICSPETKEKISAARKGKTYEEFYGVEVAAEIKRKNSQTKTGKILSKETRAKMSMAKSNMSLETKAKMSKAHKGKVLSDETKKRMSDSHQVRL